MSGKTNQGPIFGVVVLTYNSEKVIIQCVCAIKSALVAVSHEIVVVDNASRDDSAGLVERTFNDVKVIRNSANLGYSCGNNLGGQYLLTHACQYIAFVNPDVTVNASTFQMMHSVAEQYSDAGCIGGLALRKGKPDQRAFRKRPTYLEKLILYMNSRDLPLLREVVGRLEEQLERSHFVSLTTTTPVYSVSGACILFPAAIYTKIGGFDERTFLFQEEFIISERLQQNGFLVYGCPQATYEHIHGHSVNRRLLHAQRAFIDSEQYLVRTYYQWNWLQRVSLLMLRYIDWVVNACFVGINRALKSIARLLNTDC